MSWILNFVIFLQMTYTRIDFNFLIKNYKESIFVHMNLKDLVMDPHTEFGIPHSNNNNNYFFHQHIQLIVAFVFSFLVFLMFWWSIDSDNSNVRTSSLLVNNLLSSCSQISIYFVNYRFINIEIPAFCSLFFHPRVNMNKLVSIYAVISFSLFPL